MRIRSALRTCVAVLIVAVAKLCISRGLAEGGTANYVGAAAIRGAPQFSLLPSLLFRFKQPWGKKRLDWRDGQVWVNRSVGFRYVGLLKPVA